MIVADTSPLNYLILIDAVEILPVIFQEVTIPSAVRQEFLAEDASEGVRRWMNNSPAWLKIAAVGEIDETIKLGKGEVKAISLAIELSADYIFARRQNCPADGNDKKLESHRHFGNFETC